MFLKIHAVIFFCPSLRTVFLQLWPNYHGILRTISQSVIADKGAALKMQGHTLEDIQRQLSVELTRFYLFVGRLRPVKDPAFIFLPFLEWLAEQESSHDFHLLYIGSIEEETADICGLLSLVNRNPNVHWLNSIPQSQIHALMTSAVCLINSSRSEGQPLTLMEAMAVGCPILARKIPGNLDLVSNEVTGLIFETKMEFKSCLQRITEDTDLRERLIRNAAKRISAIPFQLPNEVASYLALINDVTS